MFHSKLYRSAFDLFVSSFGSNHTHDFGIDELSSIWGRKHSLQIFVKKEDDAHSSIYTGV